MTPEKMVEELIIALQKELPPDLKDASTEEKWMYLMGIVAVRSQYAAPVTRQAGY